MREVISTRYVIIDARGGEHDVTLFVSGHDVTQHSEGEPEHRVTLLNGFDPIPNAVKLVLRQEVRERSEVLLYEWARPDQGEVKLRSWG